MKLLKKYWWVIVLLILGVGGYMYYKNKTTQ